MGDRTGILVGLWDDGLPPASFYTSLAREVEAHGFDHLFLGDHIFFNVPNPETLTLLAGLAAVTERVTLGTGVLLLALRQPAVVAKALATIDYLSNGRLVVGVGVGGEIDFEWEALGVPLTARGRRTDEYLTVLRALWTGRPVEHRGEFVRLEGVSGSPAPTQPGGPPIWIGGRSDRALQRAARYDGWCAYASSPAAIERRVDYLREAGAGPDHRVSAVVFTCVDDDEAVARANATHHLEAMYKQPFGQYLDKFCAVGTPDQVAARIDEFRSAGVTDVLLAPQVQPDAYLEQVAHLAELVGVRT